jgi:hypothetical protein
MIDIGGDIEFFEAGKLREIHPKFLNLAAQAFNVKLAGLENVEENIRFDRDQILIYLKFCLTTKKKI